MKHTKGEWVYAPHMNEHFGGKKILVDDGSKYHRIIIIASIEEHPQHPSASEANAKLIAAAPDLLEAAKQMCEAAGSLRSELIAYDKLKAAIAKATS